MSHAQAPGVANPLAGEDTRHYIVATPGESRSGIANSSRRLFVSVSARQKIFIKNKKNIAAVSANDHSAKKSPEKRYRVLLRPTAFEFVKVLSFIGLLMLSAMSAYGASVVAEYNFTAGTASVDTDPTSAASTFTAVGFTFTSNATLGNPTPSIQTTDDLITNSASTPAGPAPTSASTDYYTFTLTPTLGTSLDFTTLTLDAATLTSTTLANSFSVSLQTSLNNFTTNVNSFTINNNTTFTNLSFNLASFNSTSGTTPIEFRIVLRDDNAATTRGILLDNVILSANVIPEPSTWAMIAIGGALLAGLQRFRRKH